MNSEQFSSALDGISDDLIDAAAGAYERKNDKKKWFVRGLCVACIGLLLVVVGLIRNLPAGTADPTQPTIALQNPTTTPTTQQELPAYTGRIYFLSGTEEGMDMSPMQVDMTLPVNSVFRVRNLQGMTKSEADLAVSEEYAFAAEFKRQYKNSDGSYHQTMVLPYNTFSNGKLKVCRGAFVQYVSAGKASLILPDASEIKSFETETTGMVGVNGGYGIYNQDVTIGEGETAVTIPEGCYRIYLHLWLGDVAYDIFQEDPDTPLTTLCDTIKITVNYIDGTKELVVIDVTVDDDGRVYMTQRGDSISA